MKTGDISSLFELHGLKIENFNNESIFDFNYAKIVSLFEKHGIILFRNFDIAPDRLTDFTDIYTEKYARDAYRRKSRFKTSNIHDVDLGRDAHTLHSEASYSPACPEVIWFYCNIPPVIGGETILCDGIKLWKKLSNKTKAFFLTQPMRFDLEVPTGIIRKRAEQQLWVPTTPGTSGFIDWNKGSFVFTQLQYAVQITRLGNSLSFSNHLLAELGKDPQIKNNSMIMADGNKVPKKYLDEIKEKSNKLTYDHIWKKNDLLMIDNKRFLHGRRSFDDKVDRDIVIVQTQRASFGYGSTTRNKIVDNE
tara:strand:+ start:318 stop:1235 length:918 start_codon:yes stop_codon:yes gene_type:complete